MKTTELTFQNMFENPVEYKHLILEASKIVHYVVRPIKDG